MTKKMPRKIKSTVEVKGLVFQTNMKHAHGLAEVMGADVASLASHMQKLFEIMNDDEFSTYTDDMIAYLKQPGSIELKTPNDYFVLGMGFERVRQKFMEGRQAEQIVEALNEVRERMEDGESEGEEDHDSN